MPYLKKGLFWNFEAGLPDCADCPACCVEDSWCPP